MNNSFASVASFASGFSYVAPMELDCQVAQFLLFIFRSDRAGYSSFAPIAPIAPVFRLFVGRGLHWAVQVEFGNYRL
jgi:hypothetical protein